MRKNRAKFANFPEATARIYTVWLTEVQIRKSPSHVANRSTVKKGGVLQLFFIVLAPGVATGSHFKLYGDRAQ
jgi:hypothetical protein